MSSLIYYISSASPVLFFCLDKYDSEYYKRSLQKNPVCLQIMNPAKKTERAIRGGNWGTKWAKSGLPAYLSNRSGIVDNYRVSNLSFRVVLGNKIEESNKGK